jgi:anti-sigma B factor antagonist
MRDDDFHVTVLVQDHSTTLVSVRGGVDVATSPWLLRLISAVQTDSRRARTHSHVVVDLSGVTLLDASGLGVLAAAARAADRNGDTFVLRDPSPRTKRVLDISRLTSAFRIEEGCSTRGDRDGRRQRRSRSSHARELDLAAEGIHPVAQPDETRSVRVLSAAAAVVADRE